MIKIVIAGEFNIHMVPDDEMVQITKISRTKLDQLIASYPEPKYLMNPITDYMINSKEIFILVETVMLQESYFRIDLITECPECKYYDDSPHNESNEDREPDYDYNDLD